MSALVIAAVATALLAPVPAPAQQWSPEQQEVWEFELSCQESKEAWIDCFHEDYVAWDMDLRIPLNKEDVAALSSRGWDVDERLNVHLKPLAINVRGDLAIALVMYTTTVRNGDTGEVVTRSEAWTDVCIKENGRWYWIADHGTLVDGG